MRKKEKNNLSTDTPTPSLTADEALQDWLPDTESAPHYSSTDSVALIEDPFNLPNLRISEDQQSSEELILDDELDLDEDMDLKTDAAETEATLAHLAEVMSKESDRQIQELEALTPDQAEEAAKLLAEQIAADEALNRQLLEEEQALQEADNAVDEELQAALPKQPEVQADGSMDLDEMESCLEALLFMSDKPISLEKLHELLGPSLSFNIFQEALTSLKARFQRPCYGIELVEVGGGLQFRTKPGRAPLAKKLAKVQTQRLSSGAMETLAIVAYRQPVMKEEVDKIRGVDSSHFMRGLIDKKLVKISGRSELPGRPMLYVTTPEFLELFGLKDLSAMPSLREIEQMVPSSQSKNPEENEDPRVKEMRRLVSEMKNNSSSILDYDPREDEQILKEIRERVNAIPTSTPYIEEQKALEKQQAMAATLVPTDGQPPELFPHGVPNNLDAAKE